MSKIRKAEKRINHYEWVLAYMNEYNATHYYKKKSGYFLKQLDVARKNLDRLIKSTQDETH